MSYKRLKFIVSLINETNKVIDIGTDHCFVPILLLKKYSKILVDASDVNINPLNIAKKNLEKEKLNKKVNLYLSDGLKNIDIHKYDTFIIAGMGGNEISKIIEQKKVKGRFIFHPTANPELVRKSLWKNGYKITNEFIIKERNIFNLIIEATNGYKIIRKKDQYIGPILKTKNDIDVKDYFLNIEKKNNELFKITNNKKFLRLFKYTKGIKK